ncbi:MAG: hypothetical protein UT86_C0001G0207 [Candidatus Magasanikbacteria bacterium GW2011_GWC2_40_17]|uniref:VTT domain-containing protein n=1 Tax=Candidatus Magasanikbacteria bacterium GW2011_GWA2_42_32 TaxID=1619039 RepID=A0A0G1A942_9BACT|nr:MAG: hypothetical protein UT86_C0001G0207 [Candidatus Magasanikbacteria bacterium GW2011_GWC2_40_17]KKS57567.1 MAG: hypothetical protein UV20_C0001G0207 [Candidatus Magasanikbacteria bacterium GW2011_GWA2_42_32]OGH85442.1 MAG: alkaline phosphatase [Candidatus Magasanikbacteria bacterium RIFOXYB2_FULL_38_10]
MITGIIEFLGRGIIFLINALGYSGIVLTMAIESACIPLPSEIIMPFAGYLVSLGRFSLWQVAFWGAVGNLLGSWLAYAVGYFGGRPFLERYGKYILMHKDDLDLADRWFRRHGQSTVFFSRLLPVIRTFISLPAGIVKMNFWKFSIFSFLGAWPWSFLLAWVGFKMGGRWQDLRVYFHRFDLLIGVFLVAGIFLFIRRHFKK